MTHWLLVERLENWEVDRKEGFRRFGLPARKQRLAEQMRKGDKLIFYVSSGLSQFADIREVSEDGVFALGTGGGYDTAFPLFIATTPRLTLDPDKWVPIRDLIPKLSITSSKNDWRQVMRTSLREISDEDAEIIIDAMNQAARNR
jgi:predicted RNA-binding protein